MESLTNNCRLVRVIDKSKTYKGKDGNEYPSTHFYLTIALGEKTINVAVFPAFKEDYQTLKLFAPAIYKE